ncbi:MAG: hypothetical protein AB7P40_25660 [Chloroflexota bacterium]
MDAHPLEAGLESGHALALPSPADRLARAISIVCAPPVMILPLIALAVWQTDEFNEAVVRGSLTFFLATSVLPSLFVYAAYRAGFVSSPDLPRRSERLQPSVFAAVCAVAAYPLLRAAGAAAIFLPLSSALAVQLLVLALVTIWWKISYHAAGVAGLTVVALAWGGTSLALPFMALSVMVAWARLHLRRHTRSQVVAGWLSALPVLWWTWPV